MPRTDSATKLGEDDSEEDPENTCPNSKTQFTVCPQKSCIQERRVKVCALGALLYSVRAVVLARVTAVACIHNVHQTV